MRRRLPVVTVLLLATVLAGCSDAEPGEAHPTTSSSSRSPGNPTETPAVDAPKVENPLTISEFRASPCDSLTRTQVDGFFAEKIAPEEDAEAPTGPTCSWNKSGSRARINVAFPELSGQGLSTLYSNRNKYAFFFELKPIEGYPVIAYDTADSRGNGDCSVRIGTSDQETVGITLYLSESKVGELDPCQAARDQVAVAVIGNIKARN